MAVKKFTVPLLLLCGCVTTSCLYNTGHLGMMDPGDETGVVQAPKKHVKQLDRCIREVATAKASLEDIIAWITKVGIEDSTVQEHFRYTQTIMGSNPLSQGLNDTQSQSLENRLQFKNYLHALAFLEYLEGGLQRIRANWDTVSAEAVNSFHKEIARIIRFEQLGELCQALAYYMGYKYPKSIQFSYDEATMTMSIFIDHSILLPNGEELLPEDREKFNAIDYIGKTTRQKEISPESLTKLIDTLRALCRSVEDKEYLYIRYNFNTLQLCSNIEEAVQSFFKEQFKEKSLGAENYKRCNPKDGIPDRRVTKEVLDTLDSASESLVGPLVQEGASLEQKKRKTKLLNKYLTTGLLLEHLVKAKQKTVDPIIKQALAALPPPKPQEAPPPTAAATASTAHATESALEAQISDAESEETPTAAATTSTKNELAGDPALPSSSGTKAESEEELVQHFDDWQNMVEQRAAPSQQELEEVKTRISKDDDAQLFLDVVFGKARQPLKKKHFKAFLKAVKGSKVKMAQNGYIDITLVDETVETKYWVPNLSADTTLNEAPCTIHQPHGNGEFPRRTCDFFKRQLAARGYDQLVQNEEVQSKKKR